MTETTTYTPSSDEKTAYDERLAKAREEEAKTPPTLYKGKKVIWKAHPGSQTLFLQSPFFETLYHGTRGPGKTDALLWSFAQHVGKGHGPAWRGIIFRQSYPQLADVQAKSEKWFRQVFPGAKFNRTRMMWEWPTGEALMFRHMQRADDYWAYHGHEYPFIGWEELTNWADDRCYKSMFSCCRSSTPGVPRMVRATTNPYGVGHNWVKGRFSLSGQWWKTIIQHNPTSDNGDPEPKRAAIHGHINENTTLLEADPSYLQTITASASNKAMEEAWSSGSWDIVAGGMFDDVWLPQYNILPAFPIPLTWRLDRSFDWGSTKPFSVGWWAQSDGSDVLVPGRGWTSTVRGDLFRISEWYGWNGRPNEGLRMLATEIAAGIIEREMSMGIHGRVKSGPADSAIYDVENGVSIGLDMAKPVRVNGKIVPGVSWTRADKRPGSRVAGWETVRKMMKAAHRQPGFVRENPGLFVFPECDNFTRTVPNLPRDESNLDDVDTEAEDHIGDEVRYKCRSVLAQARQARSTGMY